MMQACRIWQAHPTALPSDLESHLDRQGTGTNAGLVAVWKASSGRMLVVESVRKLVLRQCPSAEDKSVAASGMNLALKLLFCPSP